MIVPCLSFLRIRDVPDKSIVLHSGTYGTAIRLSTLVKVKVKQSHYRPAQALRLSRRLRLPDFTTIGT